MRTNHSTLAWLSAFLSAAVLLLATADLRAQTCTPPFILGNDSPTPGAILGSSVAFDGTTAAIGAPCDPVITTECTVTFYVYHLVQGQSSWTLDGSVPSPSQQGDDRF